MYFLYKVKKVQSKNNEIIFKVDLYDFILGKVEKFIFNDELFVNIEQEIYYKLKNVKITFSLREIK